MKLGVKIKEGEVRNPTSKPGFIYFMTMSCSLHHVHPGMTLTTVHAAVP